MREADLTSANLIGANLFLADLRGANLCGADLRRANLLQANLRDADLTNAKLPDFQLPSGELVGWKKCDGIIVKLAIPAEARRTASLIGNKCRAEYVIVLKVNNTPGIVQSWTNKYKKVTYKVGETVRPHNGYSEDARIECARGIHFFRTKKEARVSTF